MGDDRNFRDDGSPVLDKQTAGNPSGTEFDVHRLLAEAEAFATYIARHGDVLVVSPAAVMPNSADRLQSYTELLAAIGTAKENETAANWQRLMTAYARMTEFTFAERGVNGRTILDTLGKTADGARPMWKRFYSPRTRPLRVGIILFLAALVMELAAAWAGSLSSTEDLGQYTKSAYMVITTLGPFLIPAAWGGIGSCIFLMKRLTDLLFNLAYEESRVKGDGTRVYLGAMLGVIIVVVFFPEFDQNIQLGTVNFGPATAAFLGGLGVKPVYAGFEALAEGLAKRVSGKE